MRNEVFRCRAGVVWVTMLFLVSCASPPEQVYLHGLPSDIKRIAFRVSTANLDVAYYRQTRASGVTDSVIVLAPLLGILPGAMALTTEGTTKGGRDRGLAARAQQVLRPDQVRATVESEFLSRVKESKLMDAVQFLSVPDSRSDAHPAGDYDALLTITVADLSLRGTPGGTAMVYASMMSQMVVLPEGKTIWRRMENGTGGSAGSVESFLADDGKTLKSEVDSVLRVLARRLAYDVAYSR